MLADRLLAAGLGKLGTWAQVPGLRYLGRRREMLADRLSAGGLGNLVLLAARLSKSLGTLRYPGGDQMGVGGSVSKNANRQRQFYTG